MKTEAVAFEFLRMTGNHRRFGKLLFSAAQKPKGQQQKIFLLDDLAESGRAKLKDIAVRTGHSSQNLCMLFAGLEKDGLVARTVDPTNRRNTYYELTAHGQHLLNDCKQEAREMIQKIFAKISESDLKQLKNNLESMNIIFEKVLQEIPDDTQKI